jgi:hypothetical protein
MITQDFCGRIFSGCTEADALLPRRDGPHTVRQQLIGRHISSPVAAMDHRHERTIADTDRRLNFVHISRQIRYRGMQGFVPCAPDRPVRAVIGVVPLVPKGLVWAWIQSCS